MLIRNILHKTLYFKRNKLCDKNENTLSLRKIVTTSMKRFENQG